MEPIKNVPAVPASGAPQVNSSEYKARVAALHAEAASLGLTVSGLPPEGVTSDGVVLKKGSPYVTRDELCTDKLLDGLLPEEREANRVAQAKADQKDQARLDAQWHAERAATPPIATPLTPEKAEQNRKEVAAGRKLMWDACGNLIR